MSRTNHYLRDAAVQKEREEETRGGPTCRWVSAQRRRRGRTRSRGSWSIPSLQRRTCGQGSRSGVVGRGSMGFRESTRVERGNRRWQRWALRLCGGGGVVGDGSMADGRRGVEGCGGGGAREGWIEARVCTGFLGIKGRDSFAPHRALVSEFFLPSPSFRNHFRTSPVDNRVAVAGTYNFLTRVYSR